MKKVIRIENLDCANCAAKMEDAIRKIDGVQSANVSFMTQKLTLEIKDDCHDAVMQQLKKTCKKVEPDCILKI